MSNTTNYNMRNIAQNDQTPWVTVNTNMATLDAALAAVSHFAPKNSINLDSNGNINNTLAFGYLGGVIRKGLTIVTVSSNTIALTASATNYIEVSEAGAVTKNTTGFTSGKFPMAVVVTDATGMTSITDKRTWLVVPRNPRLAKDVAGGTDVTLDATEGLHDIIEASGALTANINLVVPTIDKQWTVANLTSGAYTLTVKTAGGTGIAIGQGKRAIVYCDGTNVVRAGADV